VAASVIRTLPREKIRTQATAHSAAFHRLWSLLIIVLARGKQILKNTVPGLFL
jgi:hypothetical protein